MVALVVLVAKLAAVFGLAWSRLLPLLIAATSAGVSVSYADLRRMRRQGLDATVVVQAAILARKAGLDVSVEQLEAHSRAGGDIRAVVTALILADRAGVDLGLTEAADVDLAGQDPAEMVRTAVAGATQSAAGP